MNLAIDYNCDMNTAEMGQRLLICRRNLKWNQDTLSGRAGISRTYISDIERGKAKSVSIEIVASLAQVLSVPASYLLGETDVPGVDTIAPGNLEDIAQSLGRRLWISRQDLGLTQMDLADKVGISHAYISDIERGKTTNVSADILIAIAKALDVSAAYLLGETEYPLPPYTEGLVVAEEQVIYNVEDPAIRDLLSIVEQMDAGQRRQLVEIARIIHHT